MKSYGAWWCQPCRYQEELFYKKAWKIMVKNNTECYEEGSFEMNQICKKAEINNLPAWDIGNERITGVLTLEQLSEISGCPYNG